ncbi:MAG: hypothetical protein WC858_01520 [Parcubacteria group bacterium]
MKKPILRFIGYALLTLVLFYIVAIFYTYIFSIMLCAACFMTIHGPNAAIELAVLFILILCVRIYWIIYKEGGKGHILRWIFWLLGLYFILTPILVFFADLLNIGGPYNVI